MSIRFFKDQIAETSKLFEWVSSGTSPSSASVAILDSSESVVSSSSMRDLSNGLFRATMYTPSSEGFYVVEYKATVGGKQFVEKRFFRTILGEID